jgi:membrane fusion protein, copper/silver efflux system
MKKFMISSIVLVSAVAIACGQQQSATAAGSPATTHTFPDAQVESLPAEAAEALQPAINAYLTIQERLAADSTTGITAEAQRIEQSAQAARPRVPEQLQSEVEALVSAAAKMKGTAEQDIDTLRNDFGSLSRSMVALMAAAPPLAEGKHLMMCPMVKGDYQQWVQTDARLANPYYGSRMLRCGETRTEWRQ